MEPEKINRAIHLTNIFRRPERKIFTFGDTNFFYFILSFLENRLILRKGNLKCYKPTIISSESLLDMFKGFSADAVQFAEKQFSTPLSRLKVLGYQFKNEFLSEDYYNLSLEQLLDNITDNTPDEELKSTAILSSPNDIWNISLVKVAFEIIIHSANDNFQDLADRGYFTTSEQRQKQEIETLFAECEHNKSYIKELGKKLQEYGLFSEYEERFFRLV